MGKKKEKASDKAKGDPKKSKKKKSTAAKIGRATTPTGAKRSSSSSKADKKVPAAKVEKSTVKKRKRLFKKELRQMLYGFGDVAQPHEDTVELLDDIAHEYITSMTLRASKLAAQRGKMKTEDIVFLVRKDPKKYARAKQLLKMNEELKSARKYFNDVDE